MNNELQSFEEPEEEVTAEQAAPAAYSANPSGAQGIAAVEQLTGIAKDTLRIWERRYGFPRPRRESSSGARVYPPEQVLKLRLLKRLLDAGHRPGRIVTAELAALQALLAQDSERTMKTIVPGAAADEFARCLALLRADEVDGLRRRLAQAVLRMGLGPAVQNLIAPLTTQVGDSWLRCELDVFQEHAYSETLQLVLRQAIQSVPPLALAEQPRVLLSTLPGEQHGLGLLMAEAMLCLEGCPCIALGVQTPVDQLARAARAHRASIVGLSFSGCQSVNQVLQELAALRAALPPAVEIWVGGRSPILQRRVTMAGTHAVPALSDVPVQVARWRAANASGA